VSLTCSAVSNCQESASNMNVFELLLFLLFCVGFLRHLISPRYGLVAAAAGAAPVLALLLVSSFRKMLGGDPTWVEEARSPS